MNKPCAAAVLHRQTRLGFRLRLLTALLHDVGCTGQVKATQLTGSLIAVPGKRQLGKNIQPASDAPKLIGKLEHSPPTLAVALLMNTGNDLTAQALQQGLERLTDDVDIGASLPFFKRRPKDLLTFLARQLIKKIIETRYRVCLGQHQVNRNINVQLAKDLVQTNTYLSSDFLQTLVQAIKKNIHRQCHQHTAERLRSQTSL
ncbi:Replication fork clamp-binding protein CrfC [Pseudomonas syringae pv. actinidiae]|uniref:Replication fork clamp-binding protein CrfC n=1 Tax=Pseudomonas syringae pv. actinidiae TaxID=103796 RepID=A0A2V0QCS5_PSESF|nr:Replication fork clamp-binding protein CrfC [Pseudomonas syringae pv. actinidiae]